MVINWDRNTSGRYINYRTDWRTESPWTSTRDTVQRQRQQLQHWQGIHFSQEQGPQSLRFNILRPALSVYIQHYGICDYDDFCTIRSRTSTLLQDLLGVEPWPWRSSNSSIGVPQGRATKRPQQMPFKTRCSTALLRVPSFTEPILHNHSQGLPEIDKHIEVATSYKAVCICSVFDFTFLDSPWEFYAAMWSESIMHCKDIIQNRCFLAFVLWLH